MPDLAMPDLTAALTALIVATPIQQRELRRQLQRLRDRLRRTRPDETRAAIEALLLDSTGTPLGERLQRIYYGEIHYGEGDES